MHSEFTINTIYHPLFIPTAQYVNEQSFNSFRNEYRNALVIDLYASQAKELIKIQYPRERLSPGQVDERYTDSIAGKNPDLQGCWVYYPWSNRLLHILGKSDFVALRTSRNQHKITAREQASLSKRKIGIIGLSVGHSVAMTLATERLFGKLKLADFDTLELSNLNRIRTGLHNIGLNKSIITAREIAEIDPFLNIECFTDGITAENLHHFLTEDGNLDLLIDECDDLEIKIKCRQAAKPLKIPVVMETSDRGMLDVERFDLEPERPILHGMLNDIPAEKLQNIPPQERLGLVMRIIDVKNASKRGRASLLEVGQSISTWPQLASAVTLGGGVVADVSRRILLGHFNGSGRFYVDLEQIISDQVTTSSEIVYTPPNENFNLNDAVRTVDNSPQIGGMSDLTEQHLRQIVEAGTQASSWGNEQPWKWIYRNKRLYLFLDSDSTGLSTNVKNAAMQAALGAAFKNIHLSSSSLGYEAQLSLAPLPGEKDLLATIGFIKKINTSEDQYEETELSKLIPDLVISRRAGLPYELSADEISHLCKPVTEIQGARIDIIQHADHLSDLARIVGACDLLMLLNQEGHKDFFRTTIIAPANAEKPSETGIDLTEIAVDPAHGTALSILSDPKIAELLRDINGGNLIAERIQAAVSASSGIAVLSLPESSQQYFHSGMIAQEIALRTMQLGLSVQPLLSPVSLFKGLGSGEGLSEGEKEKLKILQTQFLNIVGVGTGATPVSLLRIHKSSTIATKTRRQPLDEVLFIVNDEI
jgi:molybdopterin/thiamine biosynthesis adenylyltransferase